LFKNLPLDILDKARDPAKLTPDREGSLRKSGAMLLLALPLAAYGLVRSSQISQMSPDQLSTVSDTALCNIYVQATPAVRDERQRRKLGDCSVAHRQCVETGFEPGTAGYLQCRQLAANTEAAQRAAYVGMIQAGATMMAQQPSPPQPPTSDDHVCIAPNNVLYRC